MRALAQVILGLLLAAGPSEVHDRARSLAKDSDYAGAVALLREHLERTGGDALGHELLGRYLLELERSDEAAHHLAASIDLYEAAGDARAGAKVGKPLGTADPLTRRRDNLLAEIVRDMTAAAGRLHESGQPARALSVLEGIEPLARGKERRAIESLLEEIGSAEKAVDLDEAAGSAEADAARPLIELESEHYELECNLEEEVVHLVADTMDDIFTSYVQIYFDGDERKVTGSKAKIRVFATWDEMVRGYDDPSPGLGGWWSPGENKVTCYDTRDRTGSLDEMLDTLFHEASHQFMTMLARGNPVPTWLNEGTSCFFEGAVAMADHRVLWPDAAVDRLMNLAAMLENPGAGSPTAAQVIDYPGPGSYPGNYYAWGWGLVFFLQQWEDPETLEYTYRPLYSRYRDLIVKKGGKSRERFEEVFLGKDSPLGHETLEQFVAAWRDWILDTVRPLHVAARPEERQERRWSAAQRYLAAADARRAARDADGEAEFLARALGHIDYLRRKLTTSGAFARDLLLAQVDVLERLDRPRAAAPVLEQLLDLADDGGIELEESRYAELEERLRELDKANYALRSARSRVRNLTRRTLALLEAYAQSDTDYSLRSFGLAALAAGALDDDGELAAEAARLRELVRGRGLLLGTIRPLASAESRWERIFLADARSMDATEERIEIVAVEPVALLDGRRTVHGEYELRSRIVRAGELHMGCAHGLVVAADPDGVWVVAGIDDDGNGALWSIQRTGGGARPRRVQTFYPDEPVAQDESPDVRVRVFADGRAELQLGEREPFEFKLPDGLPVERHVGVYAKNGTLVLESPVVEQYP